MTISNAPARRVCIYSNQPTQRKIYMRRVFMPLTNVHTNQPHTALEQAAHPFMLWHLM